MVDSDEFKEIQKFDYLKYIQINDLKYEEKKTKTTVVE
jgi:endonuclease IV